LHHRNRKEEVPHGIRDDVSWTKEEEGIALPLSFMLPLEKPFLSFRAKEKRAKVMYSAHATPRILLRVGDS
jgi:hypothetical protein